MYYMLVPNDLNGRSLTAEGLLISLGVTCKLSGFRYAEYIIDRAAKDPDCLSLVTKELYPEVGNIFKVSPNAVENSIRRLINTCWENPDHTILNDIAGYTLRKKPSNCEFLHILAAYMQETKAAVSGMPESS